MNRAVTPIVLTLISLSVVPLARAQDPVPPGFVLVDDMILPEEVINGESSFTANPWPFGVVPYAFNANVSAANQSQALKAMAEISAVSGVIFIPHTVTADWIVFNASNVNNSLVGMQGGAQTINITSWGTKYIIVHEIMHALGYVHEQSRPDRNSFVTINYGNISTSACSGSNCGGNGSASCVCNFNIVNGATMATGYDFLSIMHYGRAAFSSNGVDTITCLPAYAQFQNDTWANPGIGNRTFMSLGDAQGLQQRYGTSLTTPGINSISPAAVTTSTGSFTLHVYGTDFFEGSPNGNGVQGTRIRWNGTVLATAYMDAGHLTAQIPATLISQPQAVQVSVINPSPGTGYSIGTRTLTVTCQAGALALANGTPVTVTNGCQQFSINPVYSAFNVVGVSSTTDWDIQMGSASASAAAGGNTCDFVAGSGWFGAGTIQPTTGNVTLYSGSAPATLQHVSSTPVLTGQPTIASMSAGSIVRAFHFDSQGQAGRTINIAGPTNLRWKLLWSGNTFAWRSSTGNVVAQGQVGGPPVTATGIVPAPYCIVVYSDGGPIAASADLTITMCFDFTPGTLYSSNFITTINQGAYSCYPFTVSPLGGSWNVVGVSSSTDWDLQIGPAVSQYGGSSCDYVLANGHLGGLSPISGVCSPYNPLGAPGYLQFAPTATASSVPSYWYSHTYMIVAFEFEITTPGNYDFTINAPGYDWDLHRPGTSSAWRRAADRIAGGYAANGTAVTVPNLGAGWHCAVVYHHGGITGLVSPDITVGWSATQAPSLTSISPDIAAAGSGTFTLAANGSHFTAASEVRWNGAPLPTVFMSDTELFATVDGALLAAPGSAAVSVSTPGGGTSGALPFTIGNPVPSIASLSQDYVYAGDPTFTLTVYGNDFAPGAEVRWNGGALPTYFVNSGQLDAVVDASLLVVPGYGSINISNPAPGGGESGYLYVTVYGPWISFMVQTSIPIQPPASPAITVNVYGNYFNPWSVVYANGVALPTTYQDVSNVDATLDPSLFTQAGLPGAFAISVVNTPEAVSNLHPLVVDSGNNAGLIRTHPVAPAPAAPFAVWVESPIAFAPLSLIVDAGNPVPFNNWPDPASNLVLGVTELAGSNGLWLPLVDGVGIFGPASGSAFDALGVFSLPGFAMPDPPAGVGVTLQAIYLDPAATLGFNLTYPLHTLGI